MRNRMRMLPVILCCLGITVCCRSVNAEEALTEPETGGKTEMMSATYLGVENYGAEETNRDHMNDFLYRFQTEDGKEFVLAMDNGTKDDRGNYDYPIQNLLKEQYRYEIGIQEDTVISAEEIPSEAQPFEPVVFGTPGERTLRNFLRTALEPVGTTLYIYGGGWNWQDDAASIQAKSLGVSNDWVKFFNETDAGFTYKDIDGDEEKRDPANSYYPFGSYNEYYYAGLDCSGYVGWAFYNTVETENGAEGYVIPACGMSAMFADLGYGTVIHELPEDEKWEDIIRPGDIMSLDGHVWICLGKCSDESIVILHATPSFSRMGQPGGGVQIGAVGPDETCEAYVLADQYMSAYYPEWYERYPAALKDAESYFTFEDEDAGLFSWDTKSGPVSDPDGLQDMDAGEILKVLFAEEN